MEFIDEFFNTGFEEEAEFLSNPAADPPEDPVKILVVFDNEYMADQLQYFRFEGDKPIAMCKSLDVISAKNNLSTLTIQEITYIVKEKHPDGHGITFLELGHD